MMVWDVLDGDFIWDLGSCVLFIDFLLVGWDLLFLFWINNFVLLL